MEKSTMNQNEMNELHKIGLFVSPITLVLGIVLALIFNFALPDNMNSVWMKSTFLGLFTGLMNFGFQLRGSRPNYVDSYSGKNNLMKRNVMYFFFRILVFLTIASFVVINQLQGTDENPASFNIIPWAIGYFIHLIILAIVYIVFNLKGKKVSD